MENGFNKSMDEIKDYIVSRDWGVPDPELNAKRRVITSKIAEQVSAIFNSFSPPNNPE